MTNYRNQERADFPRKTKLSPRELEVMKNLAQGLTRSQAAARLGISTHTLKSHLMRIYRFMGVINTTQALMKLHQEGLEPFGAYSPTKETVQDLLDSPKPRGVKLRFEVMEKLDQPVLPGSNQK